MAGRRRKPRPRAPRVILAAVGVIAVLGAVALLAGPMLRGGSADPTGVPGARLADQTPIDSGPVTALVTPSWPDSLIGGALAAAKRADAAPTDVPAPPPRRAAPPRPSGVIAQVIDLINGKRAAAGCGPVTEDKRITAAAQGHSEDMSSQNYFEHDSQDGRSFDQRISEEGYPEPGAENIARGQDTPDEVVEDWMNSPSHRQNIEDCSLRTTGVGLSNGYWTQDFGR